MRLLHVRDLRFEEFFDEEIPPYAILSHRWGAEGVSYVDFLAGRKRGGAGFAQIVECCKFVAGHSVWNTTMDADDWVSAAEGECQEWVWIDTCCIDKASSAELSESINSMYQWYARARVCYAYLADVQSQKASEDELKRQIGSRESLAKELAAASTIPIELLNRFHTRDVYVPVAERLRWAASRKTSRLEDRAYSLLGLFDINMPLLYGEGKGAFQRLQQEIIRTSNDESIFVHDSKTGLLAESVDDFSVALIEEPFALRKMVGLTRPPYSITNQGIEIRIPKALSKKQELMLPLNCAQHVIKGVSWAVFVIHLRKYGDDGDWYKYPNNSGTGDASLSDMMIHALPSSTLSLAASPIRACEWGVWARPHWLWSREDLIKKGSEFIYVRPWGYLREQSWTNRPLDML